MHFAWIFDKLPDQEMSLEMQRCATRSACKSWYSDVVLSHGGIDTVAPVTAYDSIVGIAMYMYTQVSGRGTETEAPSKKDVPTHKHMLSDEWTDQMHTPTCRR